MRVERTSAHRPAVAADRGDSGFDRQLASLFGESVFGPWLDPGQYWARPARPTAIALPSGDSPADAVLCLGDCGWLDCARRPFAPHVEDREHVARNLASFLTQGELDRVAQFLVLLRGPNAALDAHDAHLDLMIRAEAALYRYQDADPERLARIKPYLSSATTAPASGERILASLAVASRQERPRAWLCWSRSARLSIEIPSSTICWPPPSNTRAT